MTTTFTGSDLCAPGALELAGAIRSRRVSSREVVEAHLQRIDEVDPTVNAIPVVLRERALAAADAADRAVGTGETLGPFHGVPFTVKGSIDVAGTPTTHGVKALADAYPTEDAPAVERLEHAGGIVLGRTNLASNTVRWHCESELWGTTLNPWDRTRTPGASSGGDAAALATGMTPLGLGSDGLGSLRWPAQCCGIAALKPTLGRIPDAGIGPGLVPIGIQLTVVVGPMARRVADLRAALAVLAGPSWRDPWSVPAPLRGPDLAPPVRVALVVDPAGAGTAPQVQDGVRRAGAVLAESGYVVDEVEPPSLDVAARTLLDMLNTPEIRAGLTDQLATYSARSVQFLTAFYAVAGACDPVATVGSFAVRAGLLRAWSAFQREHPLIVAPIGTEPPFAAGSDLDDGQVAATIRSMRTALAVNALGLPAVAVPVGVADGLPQAVQVIGPRYREDLCLDAAGVLEERLGALTPIDPR